MINKQELDNNFFLEKLKLESVKICRNFKCWKSNSKTFTFYKSVCWSDHDAGGAQMPGALVVGITVPVVAHALSLLSPPSFKPFLAKYFGSSKGNCLACSFSFGDFKGQF